jgi:hypothetical protein
MWRYCGTLKNGDWRAGNGQGAARRGIVMDWNIEQEVAEGYGAGGVPRWLEEELHQIEDDYRAAHKQYETDPEFRKNAAG